MMDFQGDIVHPGIIDRGHLMVINSVTVSTCLDAADVLLDDNFGNVLQSNVYVSHVKVLITHNFSRLDSAPSLGNIGSTKGKQVDSETLAKRWNIDQRNSLNTVKQTTQRGVRTCLHPSLAPRLPTNDRMMRYKRLPHPGFSDTMADGVVSTCQNKYAQAYCTQYGWSRVHSMILKKHAHETLSLIFKRDGVPPKIVVDNSKEQTLGKFARKCREADCHLVTTEPYPPWMQAAEGCIKQTKLGSSNRILNSGSPKALWDHCIELEALIRSHIDLDIYSLEGQVPETVVSGQMGDISSLCEL